MMLIDLPNGASIDPRHIIAVEDYDKDSPEIPGETELCPTIYPCVIVTLSTGRAIRVTCESHGEAIKLKASLVEIVNEVGAIAAA